VRRKDVLSRSEQKALDLLERSLSGEGYAVYANLPLRKVMEATPGDDLSWEQESMLRRGELDFVVANRDEGFSVAFAVEYDSAYHEQPERAAKDRTKDLLCFNARIPLVRVREQAIGEREQITALEWMLDCFRLLQTDRGRVEEVRDYLDYRSEEYGEPPGDLGLAVHILNPFPASERVRARLRSRYDIRSFPRGEPWSPARESFQARLAALNEFNEADLQLTDLNHLEQFDDDYEPPSVEERVRAALDPAERETTFRLGVWRPKEKQFAYEAEVPIDWSPQHIVAQAFAAERTGSWLWAVDVALAEYRALTDVDRWASRHLVRLDRG